MTRQQWDRAASTFDEEPDHGLTDPHTLAAWRELLLGVLPSAPARIADLGCGTGTLTRLLTDAGYCVDGVDYSPEMIRHARVKVPEATFVIGDASEPPLEAASYDVVLSRHVLWAMPDPTAAFARWDGLLRPNGVAVLIEGRWSTGAGLDAVTAQRIALGVHREATIRQLPESVYWGKDIDDERYLLVSRR